MEQHFAFAFFDLVFLAAMVLSHFNYPHQEVIISVLLVGLFIVVRHIERNLVRSLAMGTPWANGNDYFSVQIEALLLLLTKHFVFGD